jgi:hypothetical protein
MHGRMVSTWAAVGFTALAAAAEMPIAGVADNSFFIEEAYNQDAGVMQSIITAGYDVTRLRGADDKQWALTFIQEFPIFSQRHQLAYAVPYLFTKSGGDREEGFGDATVEYRWQAFFHEESLTALAPKVGVILPTGRESRGLGDDTVGLELGLPFSTALHERVGLNLNAGMAYLPEAASLNDRDAVHFDLGASLIYAFTPSFHALVETVGTWEETLNSRGRKEYDFGAIVSPGVRKAFDVNWNDAQLVLGAAVPLGVGGNAPDWGVFLYLSFEHLFRREQ